MRKLSRLQNAMEASAGCSSSRLEVMDEDAHLPEKPNAVTLGPLTRAIELKDVSFGYANEARSVLHNINLRVPAGSMVALVVNQAVASRR